MATSRQSCFSRHLCDGWRQGRRSALGIVGRFLPLQRHGQRRDVGGNGNNRISGGGRNDRFIFGVDDGRREIRNFIAAGDEGVIDLSATIIAGYDALIAGNAVQDGAKVVFSSLCYTAETSPIDVNRDDLIREEVLLAV